MPLKLQTIRNPRVSLEPDVDIDYSTGAIDSIKLQVNTMEPNQLQLIFNTQLGDLYDYFESGDFRGLRLSFTSDTGIKTFDMGFIELEKGKKQTTSETGQVVLQFESLSKLLADTENFPRLDVLGLYSNFDSQRYFPDIVAGIFTWDVITRKRKKFFSGLGSVLDTLNTGVEEYANFEWREVGIVDVSGTPKCLIEVGDPLDRRFRGYIADRTNPHISANDGFNIEVSNIVKRTSGSTLRSVIPRIANGANADPASVDVTFITNTGVVQQDSDFPLAPSGFKVKTLKGLVDIYKVINRNVPTTSRGDFIDVQSPASMNVDGENVSDQNIYQVAYDRSVFRLKQTQEAFYYDVDFNLPFILPAGEPFELNYLGVLPNNETLKINGIQYISAGFEYNLSNFVTR